MMGIAAFLLRVRLVVLMESDASASRDLEPAAIMFVCELARPATEVMSLVSYTT